MLTTTTSRLAAQGPCDTGRETLLTFLAKPEPDDEPVSYATILDVLGLESAIWSMCAEPEHITLWRQFAVWCAAQVAPQALDFRSANAVAVAQRHLTGDATRDDLDAAWASACASAWDARQQASPRAAFAANAARDACAACARDLPDAFREIQSAAIWAAKADPTTDQASAFRRLVTTGHA